ncbi:phage tail protein [Yunchengibacter salinarum]|uniref:phage tail protein n=1 Tax=Yunchengibacter salinarum TaxID=3133399 RepID=UPI0035B640BA
MGKVVKQAVLVGGVAALTVATGGSFLGLGGAVSAGLGVSTVVGGAIAGSLVGLGLGVASELITPALGDTDEQAGQKLPVANSVETRRIVYGRARLGGSEIFIEEFDSTGADDVPNDTVVFARLVADHPITGFDAFRLGDEVIPLTDGAAGGDFDGRLFVSYQTGHQTTADPLLLAAPGWTDDHVGVGLAYYAVRAVFDPAVFPYGIGEVRRASVEVRGKPVYDPRADGSQPGGSGSQRLDDPDSWAYSTNPALCILDFLKDGRLGNPVPVDEIHMASVITAANVCDEWVPTREGGQIRRYSLGGVVDSGRSKYDQTKALLTAMGGRMMWLGGQVHLFAAAPVPLGFHLDEQSVVSLAFDTLPEADARFNLVRGTYVDPDEGFEAQDYPAAEDTAARAGEGDRPLALNLPFTQDHRIAQRLARIALMESRQSVAELTAMPAAAALAPMDGVALSWANFGLVGEGFRIVDQTLESGEQGMRVSLGLRREDPAIYHWDPGMDERPRGAGARTVRATGRETVSASGVTVAPLTLDAADGRQMAALEVSWSPPSRLVASTLVDFRREGENDWRPGGSAFRGDHTVLLMLPETARVDVRVRHVLADGQVGPATEVLGAQAPDVDGLGVVRWSHIVDDGARPQDNATFNIGLLADRDRVDTPEIAPGAVSRLASTVINARLPLPFDLWTQVAALTVTKQLDGSALVVRFTLDLQGFAGDERVTWRILQDGQTMRQRTMYLRFRRDADSTSGTAHESLMFEDVRPDLAAGGHSYVLQVRPLSTPSDLERVFAQINIQEMLR